MRRRVWRLLAAAAVVLSVPAAPPASAAGAASIIQVGWWSQRPGAAELPEGGFELALAPNGPISQAALRVQVTAVQLTSALLELTPSDEFGAGVASVHACPTNDAWAPANPGAWDDRPEPDCDRKDLPLSRRQTGEWLGDVAELLNIGTHSIVLVPMSHPDTQGFPAPYQLVFESAKLTASAPTPPPPNPPGDGGGSPSSSEGPSIIAVPDTPPVAQNPGPPLVVVEPEDDPTPIPEAPLAAAPTAGDEPGEPRPWWRLALLLPLSGALGAAAVFARRYLRERDLA